MKMDFFIAKNIYKYFKIIYLQKKIKNISEVVFMNKKKCIFATSKTMNVV